MITHSKIIASAFVYLSILNPTVSLADGGSSIGNGGDTVQVFLEGTRYALTQTIDRILELKQPNTICDSVEGLRSEQKKRVREIYFRYRQTNYSD